MNLLILKAEEEWKELHPDAGEDEECLLPLIRIRVSLLSLSHPVSY